MVDHVDASDLNDLNGEAEIRLASFMSMESPVLDTALSPLKRERVLVCDARMNLVRDNPLSLLKGLSEDLVCLFSLLLREAATAGGAAVRPARREFGSILRPIPGGKAVGFHRRSRK